MYEDIDDFEPDWNHYYSMSLEEKKARREIYRIYERYCDNKISYGKYLEELERINANFFYSILNDSELEEIKKYKDDLAQKNAAMELERQGKLLRKKAENEQIKKVWTYIFILILVLSFIAGLLDG
jgi:hypothetical protein